MPGVARRRKSALRDRRERDKWPPPPSPPPSLASTFFVKNTTAPHKWPTKNITITQARFRGRRIYGFLRSLKFFGVIKKRPTPKYGRGGRPDIRRYCLSGYRLSTPRPIQYKESTRYHMDCVLPRKSQVGLFCRARRAPCATVTRPRAGIGGGPALVGDVGESTRRATGYPIPISEP